MRRLAGRCLLLAAVEGTHSLGECRLVQLRSLSKSAGGKKHGSTLVQLAVSGLDRALQLSRGKKPEWKVGEPPSGSLYDAVDRLAGAAVKGSLDKSLAPVLRDSTEVAAKVLRRLIRPEDAVQFFIWAAKQSGFKHDAETWNQLMDNFSRGGRALEAYELFKQRFSRMHKPEMSTYTILVKGLCEAKHTEQACELFNEMQRRGIQPGKALFAFLLNALVATGRLDDAVAYYQMEDHKLDPATCSALVNALGKHERLENSVKVMQDMIQRNCSPEPACLAGHVELLCTKGRATDARKILDQLSGKGYRMENSVLHTLVVESLCKAGNLEEAVDMFEEMVRRNCKRDVVTYSVIVEGMYNAGKLSGAFRFMERMVNDGCLPDVASFHRLLDAHGGTKTRRKPTMVMYSMLIFGLCRDGNVDEAVKLYKHLLAGKSSPPSLLTYTVVIDGLGKAGRGTEAEGVFEEMIRGGFTPDTVTYNVLLSALCAAGCVTRAVEHFKEMSQRNCKPDLKTYMVLLEGLEKLDGVDEAVNHVKEAAEKRLEISKDTYEAVVASLSRAGL